MMFRKNIWIFIFIVTLFNSCDTDKTKKDKSEEVVKNFVANLALDNYDLLYTYYPNFKKVKSYWRLDDFKITSTIINDDNSISIIGTSENGNIMFKIEKEGGKYKIIESKGVASVFNAPIYKYCKKIGCIGSNDYDKDISQICTDKQDEFNQFVNKVKTDIESNFDMQNNNLKLNYGYLSGNVTVRNNSRFSILGGTYKIYYHFLNTSGKIGYTLEESSNYQNILYGQSITQNIFESNLSGYSKIQVEIKIISNNFIEKIIADNADGKNCINASNF